MPHDLLQTKAVKCSVTWIKITKLKARETIINNN